MILVFIFGFLCGSSIFLTSSEQRNIVQLCTSKHANVLAVKSSFNGINSVSSAKSVNSVNHVNNSTESSAVSSVSAKSSAVSSSKRFYTYPTIQRNVTTWSPSAEACIPFQNNLPTLSTEALNFIIGPSFSRPRPFWSWSNILKTIAWPKLNLTFQRCDQCQSMPML